MVNQITLHPDDLLFYNEVCKVMRKVAKDHDLPLKSIEALTMPKKGMADRLGQCSMDGVIKLVFRCTVNGVFCEDPRSPSEVWETAAHELAHLKHFNHGPEFQSFRLEMQQALENRQEDYQQKVLRKLVKLQTQREDAARRAAAGAEEAAHEAEAFAGMINKMLIDNELSPTDIDYARSQDEDPVIELMVDLSKYRIKKVGNRVEWQNTLARIVSNAHLCSYLVRSGSNSIWFVGTKSHATVAEYVFGTLVPIADRMSDSARRKHRDGIRKEHGIKAGRSINHLPEAQGFREAWLAAFTQRISERFSEARAAAVKETEERLRASGEILPGGESTALLRLDQALVKVRRYVDDKFKSKKSSAGSLSYRYGNNAAGRAAGRAAADAMAIGRRGLTGGSSSKLIGGK